MLSPTRAKAAQIRVNGKGMEALAELLQLDPNTATMEDICQAVATLLEGKEP